MVSLLYKIETYPFESVGSKEYSKKNPNVALLIDKYNEDWSKLFLVMIQGKGSLGKFTGQNDENK
jgi:hypothetical protein